MKMQNRLVALMAATLSFMLIPERAFGVYSGVWGAETGALSYSFFNLTGENCRVHAFGGGANPAAMNGSLAQAGGWNSSPNLSLPHGRGLGFFNKMGPTMALGTPAWSQVLLNAFTDPIQPPLTAYKTANNTWVTIPFTQDGGINGLPYLQSVYAIEYSRQFGGSSDAGNASVASLGDSWTVTCGNSEPSKPMLMANLASAGPYMITGPTNHAFGAWFNDRNMYSEASRYIFLASYLNPAGPGNNDRDYEVKTGTADPQLVGNPVGMGFTNGGPGTLMQVTPYQRSPLGPNYTPWDFHGGLWPAASNPNSDGKAIYNTTQAIFPVNYSNYVNQDNNTQRGQERTAIYGGHFTMAIGDPFIVSSFSAKMLWYMAINPDYWLSNNTFITSGGIAKLLEGPIPVFSDGAGRYYKDWLLSSSSIAAYTAQHLMTEANKPIEFTETNNSFWRFAARIAMVAANQAAGVYGKNLPFITKDGWSDWLLRTAVNSTTGELKTWIESSLLGDKKITGNAPAPTTQQAPMMVNESYSANNMLGMLLANTQFQSDITKEMRLGSIPNPLWSNTNIYLDNLCNHSTISVVDNYYTDNVECRNAQGQLRKQYQINPNPQYVNIYTGKATRYDNRLNAWDALLSGSTISTNQDGLLILSDPTTAGFQPPTQVYSPDGAMGKIGTAFNYTTGYLSLLSYQPLQYPNDVKVSEASTNFNVDGCLPWVYHAYDQGYDQATGQLTITSVQGGCGGRWTGYPKQLPESAKLNLSFCEPGSGDVILDVTLDSTGLTPLGASLRCAIPKLPTVYNAHASGCYYSPVYQNDSSTGEIILTGVSTSGPTSCPQYGTMTPQRFAYSQCVWGTAVQLSPPDRSSGNVWHLECTQPQPKTEIATASQPKLDYNQCVNDPNATGGVIASNRIDGSGNPGLACACTPAYLRGNAGDQTLYLGHYATTGSPGGLTEGTNCPTP